MKKLDPIYLDLLHYTRIEKCESNSLNKSGNHAFFSISSHNEKPHKTWSALHEAFRDGNNRVMEQLMQYMA